VPKIRMNHRRIREALIVLGLVVVVAGAAVGSMRLFSPQKTTLVVARAGAQVTHCAPGYPGKPPSPCFKPAPPPPPAKVACTKGDLRLSEMWPGAYQGFTGEAIELVNASDVPCYLTGAPPMQVTTTSGAVESVSRARADFASKQVDIQPGQDLFIGFGSPGGCAASGTSDRASSVTFTLPGGTMTVNGLKFAVNCGRPVLLVFSALSVPMYPPTTPTIPPNVPASKIPPWLRTATKSS